jgi:replication factor C small subunit
LGEWIARASGTRALYFYDAIAPIVETSSIDREKSFLANRYGKGGEAAYINCPLSREECSQMVEKVAKAEGLKLDSQTLEAILYVSEGDMRRAINSLQGASLQGKSVSAESVYQSAGRAEPAEVKEMMELAIGRKFTEARKKLHQLMISYGMSGEDVLLQMYRTVDLLDISEREKVALVDKIGEYNFRLVEGANETLQIEALLAQLLMLKSA